MLPQIGAETEQRVVAGLGWGRASPTWAGFPTEFNIWLLPEIWGEAASLRLHIPFCKEQGWEGVPTKQVDP